MSRLPLACSTIVVLLVAIAQAEEPERHLEMSKAVACRKIDGYEDFEPLDEPKVTTEDKLLIYYRPLNYEYKASKSGGYLAHFKQDVKVRKRGEKKVLWTKEPILDFEATSPDPTKRVYLTNSIGVRGFPPGDYDLDIILHDALKPGSSATQTLRFTVVAAPPAPKAEADETPEAETDGASPEAGPKPSQGKPAKKTRRPR